MLEHSYIKGPGAVLRIPFFPFPKKIFIYKNHEHLRDQSINQISLFQHQMRQYNSHNSDTVGWKQKAIKAWQGLSHHLAHSKQQQEIISTYNTVVNMSEYFIAFVLKCTKKKRFVEKEMVSFIFSGKPV